MSDLWLEDKYVNYLGQKLKMFRRDKPYHYTFRCPICGDSKKNQYKRRGSIYIPPHATSYNMGCFNCGASMSFFNFLKLQDPFLYNEYVIEKYKSVYSEEPKEEPKPEIKQQNSNINPDHLINVGDMDDDHPVVKYLNKRKIPQEKFSKLYFVKKYYEYESICMNKKLDKNRVEHPRLIIPFFDKRGNVYRISARSFFPEHAPKYLSIKFKEDASRVYGLDTVDKNKTVYVLEGPLDSLFIDNSIAVGTSSLLVPELKDFSSVVLIPDNQPRNREVCLGIKKMVDSGYPVCLWNKDCGKDINEMIKNGMTIDQVMELIKSSTVSGMAAMLKFNTWIKVRI